MSGPPESRSRHCEPSVDESKQGWRLPAWWSGFQISRGRAATAARRNPRGPVASPTGIEATGFWCDESPRLSVGWDVARWTSGERDRDLLENHALRSSRCGREEDVPRIPPSNPRRVSEPVGNRTSEGPTLILIADGWTRHVFLDLLDQGRLPEIRDELVVPGQLIDPVISIFPTVSIASHATLLTGTSPADHRIPGHRWMDSTTGLITNYVGLRNFVTRGIHGIDDDLASEVPTVFERQAPRHSEASPSLVARGASRRSKLRAGGLDSGELIRNAGRQLLATPDSIVVSWLPRGDVVAHRHGPEAPEVVDEMRRVSKAIGLLARTLTRAGLIDTTRILLVPDHGHRAVQEHGNLRAILAEAGVTAAQNPRRRRSRGHPLALTSGDSSALIYGIDALGADRMLALLRRLALSPAIGLAFWREGDRQSYVADRRGMSRIEYCDAVSARVTVMEGDDPLGLTTSSRIIEYDDPRRVDWRFPDIVYQYRASYVAGRSASVLVTAAAGYDFGRGPRLGWRWGFHRGSHGGPLQDEILVSAVYRGPNRVSEVEGGVRSQDLLSHLGILDRQTAIPGLQLDSDGRR